MTLSKTNVYTWHILSKTYAKWDWKSALLPNIYSIMPKTNGAHDTDERIVCIKETDETEICHCSGTHDNGVEEEKEEEEEEREE